MMKGTTKRWDRG